jgi:hypothetical protein
MAGSLILLKSVTGSGVSSFSVENCFSGAFNRYKVVADNIVTSTAGFLELRFINSSDTIVTTSDYDFADLFLKADTTFTQRIYKNDDSIFDFNYSNGSISGGAGNTVAEIYNPFDTSYTNVSWEASSVYSNSGTYGIGLKGVGVLKQSTSITGMHFLMNTGTVTCTIKVYGVK